MSKSDLSHPEITCPRPTVLNRVTEREGARRERTRERKGGAKDGGRSSARLLRYALLLSTRIVTYQ